MQDSSYRNNDGVNVKLSNFPTLYMIARSLGFNEASVLAARERLCDLRPELRPHTLRLNPTIAATTSKHVIWLWSFRRYVDRMEQHVIELYQDAQCEERS